MLEKKPIDRTKIGLAVLSGVLLTGAFPNIGIKWLAWFSLVPLLVSVRDLSPFNGFRLGLLAGLIHYLTLIYWAAYTMNTYGDLPWALSLPVMFLLSLYLALYLAAFSGVLSKLSKNPLICLLCVPVLWVSMEYIRSFLISGFPWELLGYSQFECLHLIQISDLCGVYGVSFLIAGVNGILFFGYLSLSKKKWHGSRVSKKLSAGSLGVGVTLLGLVFIYGDYRLALTEQLIEQSPLSTITIIQGNIDQSIKWDPTFQASTARKYINLSLSAKSHSPDLIVWPETAIPFYFLYDQPLTRMVQKGIAETGTSFIIGSPSFSLNNGKITYFNSAYLINPDGSVSGRYDKVHLVPFGEYVPFKKWFPFIGKMVEHVGDFEPGEKGTTLLWKKHRLGVLICFEVIFPDLARVMVMNDSSLLINITNDAWYGRTGAPHQHFSMTVFRAVENRRVVVRSANTGISGFIDPDGRIIDTTGLFEDAILSHSVPMIQYKTFYTRFGDLFCRFCMAVTALLFWLGYRKSKS